MAKAWSEPAFKARLIEQPATALAEIDIDVSGGAAIVVRENSAKLVHLVTCAPPVAMPQSALSDIRDFGEVYRDPRLWSLNWLGRDPVATGRMRDDPLAELAKIGVHPPKGLSVALLLNTPALVHLVLPARPASRYCTPLLYEHLASGLAPSALRLGRLFGAGPYDALVAALSGIGTTTG